ncbi:MAG: copper amine oxidase N-terminal domain-containing protein [Eubacteriales bacterium]|nr:copper amine oxidase N-terminal domain-containing protein [Eubacteriales bacterium]
MRRRTLFILTFLFCMTFAITSEAVPPITFNVDGKAVTFNESTGYAYIDERDRTMIPLRVILEVIGCDVTWNPNSQMVITKKGATEVVIPIGKPYIRVNQKEVAIDTAAVLKNGRTYLPLRAVLEAYKYNVNWDSDIQTITATPAFTPNNINGGTTGVFLRRQLDFTGFDGIQGDFLLPKVELGQKGDCPYVYFGFDFPDGKGNAEGGFQFIEDQTHPGYNQWTVYLRQGNDWRWGESITLLEQGAFLKMKFYADKVSDTQTDLVIELDGKEVIRKTSGINSFAQASVKIVNAIAMSIPFDGTNCLSASVDFGLENVTVSEYNQREYVDIAKYDLYSEYKHGFWYGTVECLPEYIHLDDSGSISLYRLENGGKEIII